MSTGAEPTDDRELMAAHVAGDPDAFAELVRRHSGRLWAVALRTCGDSEEAADALQDALVAAFRSAATYRGDAAVTTWLHRVVVNACLDRMRKNRTRRTVPLPEQERELPSHVDVQVDEHAATETRIDLVQALAALPEHQRLALVLVDMEDLPVAEAAQVLGVPEGTVKSRCARGRATLAAMLRGGNPGEPAHVQGHVRGTRPEPDPATSDPSTPGDQP